MATAQPTRLQSAVFLLKSTLLKAHRALKNMLSPIARGTVTTRLSDAPVIARSVTPLWTTVTPEEFALTAGKVQNLRVAARAMNGREFSSEFSFWSTVGRPTQAKGYCVGREVREGCVIPTVAGGICQLSNALYDVALKAGFRIVERHAHSNVTHPALAHNGRDATVFWNYVDLRFAAPQPFRIEVELKEDQLEVRVRSWQSTTQAQSPEHKPALKVLQTDGIGSCENCGVDDCFRHEDLHSKPRPTAARRALLLDVFSPEFDSYLLEQRRRTDILMLPSRKPVHRWTEAGTAQVRTFRWPMAAVSLLNRLRGGTRQGKQFWRDEVLAHLYAQSLTPEVTELVISQNLLFPLGLLGVLGGRRYEVLQDRVSMVDLQRTLDIAQKRWSYSTTLTDFRVSDELAVQEERWLAIAAQRVSAHGHLHAHRKLAWKIPHLPKSGPGDIILFPGPGLARKGAYLVRDALTGQSARLRVLGKSQESPTFWQGIALAPSDNLWANVGLLVQPSLIELSPRLLLEAVARGIPVIASEACGLQGVPGVTTCTDDDFIPAVHHWLHRARGSASSTASLSEQIPRAK